MKKVEAYIRPEKQQEVIAALRQANISGFSITPVQGRGMQKDTTGIYRGRTYAINLHSKLKFEIVLSDDNVQRCVELIMNTAHTGEVGDGKIFILPILEAYNIRTGSIDTSIDELNHK